MIKDPQILFVVQAGRNFGIGHLKRCLQIASFSKKTFFIVYTDLKEQSGLESLLEGQSFTIVPSTSKENILVLCADFACDLIVIDCANASKPIKDLFETNHPTIVLDNLALKEGGDVFIQSLPSVDSSSSNFKGEYYTPIAKKFFESSSEGRGILISMGGSDPQGNALKALAAFKDSGEHITLIKGVLSNYPPLEESPTLSIKENVPDLSSYIQQSEMVICGPGMTMLESLASKKKTLVITHTWKQFAHLKNSKNCTVLYGGSVLSSAKIKKMADSCTSSSLSLPENFDFKTWWLTLTKNISARPAICPLCKSLKKKSIFRDEKESLFSCQFCKSSYRYLISRPTVSDIPDAILAENPAMPLQDYRSNVLQTKEEYRRRIMFLKQNVFNPASARLLDIGAGDGQFIQEATDNGIQSWGVERSEFSRGRNRDLFNIEIFDSLEKAYQTGAYSMVTVWNNLDSLEDPAKALIQISPLIAPSGVLAFCAPAETIDPKGMFSLTEKGGESLARRLGLRPVKTTTMLINNMKYREIYCVRP
ncbi:MAG: methyltransferase domain-containing protein [Brevinema sp.]